MYHPHRVCDLKYSSPFGYRVSECSHKRLVVVENSMSEATVERIPISDRVEVVSVMAL